MKRPTLFLLLLSASSCARALLSCGSEAVLQSLPSTNSYFDDWLILSDRRRRLPVPTRPVDAKSWRSRAIYQVLTDRFATTNPVDQRCNNLRDYCGGTLKGLIRRLDYIAEMGFNAIWISPIPENTARGYHGYWAKDLYRVNPEFGTAQELKQLVRECHRRDIWVMVDVVANHMGNTFNDFGSFYPFNSSDHYHKYCLIKNYQNQREVEYCRIGDERSSLADLDTERDSVVEGLEQWVRWLVEEFDFDSVRIDTVKHVRKEFWTGFSRAAGVFSIGEILHGDPAYVGPYQRYMDSTLNFPLYFTLREVFILRQSMWKLEIREEQNKQYFRDISILGNFVDNHDVKRFLNEQKDTTLLRNALTYIFMADGIPILYQGTELEFDGGTDPLNRESMFPMIDQIETDRSATHPIMFRFVRRLNYLRQALGQSFYNAAQKDLWTQEDLNVFLRDKCLIVTTNAGRGRTFMRTIRVPHRKPYLNVLNDDFEESLVYKGQDGDQWLVELEIINGEPKIFCTKDIIFNN